MVPLLTGRKKLKKAYEPNSQAQRPAPRRSFAECRGWTGRRWERAIRRALVWEFRFRVVEAGVWQWGAFSPSYHRASDNAEPFLDYVAASRAATADRGHEVGDAYQKRKQSIASTIMMIGSVGMAIK